MPELSVQQIVFAACIGLFTIAAAVWDWRWRKIPNTFTVPGFLAGWVYQAAFNGWPGVSDAALAFAVGFGTLFVLWMVGGGGGGDVKLMGALSVWLGLRMTLLVMTASTLFVIAGTLGVVGWMSVRNGFRKTREKLTSGGKRETAGERQQRRIMAYAIPVALATWAVVIWKLPQI